MIIFTWGQLYPELVEVWAICKTESKNLTLLQLKLCKFAEKLTSKVRLEYDKLLR